MRKVAGSSLDAFIVEGTHFGFENGNENTETELQAQIASYVKESRGLLLAAFSPQHFDRLRSFIHAANETGRTFVADVYTAFALYMASHDANLDDPLKSGRGRVYYPQSDRRKIEQRGSNKIYDRFRDVEIQLDEITETPEKYVMVFRPSMLNDFINGFPKDTLCVLSTWHGYSNRPHWKQVQNALASANGRIVHAHTSGHALSFDIIAFTRAVNAEKIIPIHTFKPEKFREYFGNVTVATDGQPIKL
jgi:ribonuclease J